VRVTNLENRRSLVVRVNDRGPYASDRLIDLSVRAAKLLGFYDRGLARVRVEYVGRASLSGSDDTKLAESLRTNEPVTPLVRVAASAQPFASTSPVVAPAFAPTPEHTMVAFGRGLY
jgi:rare lipoprotein A